MQAYIQAYARHYKLYEHIKLQCKLVQLRRSPASGWIVLYHDLKQDKYFQVGFLDVLLLWLTRCITAHPSLQFQADFAVVSTGLYATPFVPQFEVSHGSAFIWSLSW